MLLIFLSLPACVCGFVVYVVGKLNHLRMVFFDVSGEVVYLSLQLFRTLPNQNYKGAMFLLNVFSFFLGTGFSFLHTLRCQVHLSYQERFCYPSYVQFSMDLNQCIGATLHCLCLLTLQQSRVLYSSLNTGWWLCFLLYSQGPFFKPVFPLLCFLLNL